MTSTATRRRTPIPFHDPPFWPAPVALEDHVHYLAALAPAHVGALRLLVDSILREIWWQTARTPDGLATLAALAKKGRAR